MPPTAKLSLHELATRLRLASGLTIFTYVTTHLLAHSLGLAGLPAMEAGMRVFKWVWDSPPGTTLLVTALTTHITLVLAKQVLRRTLRMGWLEALRLSLGLCVLFLLLRHALKMWGLALAFHFRNTYTSFLLALWPHEWPWQTALVLLAWTHGCIGVHIWLRHRSGYRRLLPLLYPLAVLLPVLALLGALAGSQAVQALDRQPGWRQQTLAALGFPPPAALQQLAMAVNWILLGLGALLGALLALRAVLILLRNRRGLIRVAYPGGRTVLVTPGTTVLEASARGRVPHASVCGGRGRCSTCRVLVEAGMEHAPPAAPTERRVLERIQAPDNVRLACQLRPTGAVRVVPLLAPGVGAAGARASARFSGGRELELAILFADLRGFTRLSESKLPYDVVHLLNEYFQVMGRAIQAHGGHVDKFIGDGIMALFGLREGPQVGCRGALGAARAMAARLEDLNASLRAELAQPLRMGMGIHCGPVIVGELGYPLAALTAIGDTVNVASRLESACKKLQCQLIVSQHTVRRAGVSLDAFRRYRIQVRGRMAPLAAYVVPSALELPSLLGLAPAGPAGAGAPGHGAGQMAREGSPPAGAAGG